MGLFEDSSPTGEVESGGRPQPPLAWGQGARPAPPGTAGAREALAPRPENQTWLLASQPIGEETGRSRPMAAENANDR